MRPARSPRIVGAPIACLAALGLALADGASALETQTISGPVTATVRLSPDAPVIGDALKLTIEVVAEADVEVLMPEFGEALDRFSITNFVPREGLDDQGRTVLSQSYALQVDRSGEHTLPSILVEFIDRRPGRDPTPEDADAYELLTEPLILEVASVVVDAASADLAPPLGELSSLGRSAGDAWLWVGAGLLGLAALAPFAFRAWSRHRARALRKSAYEVARGELEYLLSSPHPSAEQMDAFFVRLSGIVRRYLENRFELRSPELTTEEFMGLLAGSPDLSRAHQDLLRSFLQQADLVKFAHLVPTPEAIDEALTTAARFLDETRENAPLAAAA